MKSFISTILLLLAVGFLSAQTGVPTKTITASAAGTGTVTWDKDTIYILDGFVFVNSGQTLTIEAGTVIKGKSGQGAAASALIVARGGTIMAEGTPSEPIIFTGESDDVSNPFDLAPNTVGQWGGVIILGNASTNTNPPEQAIEGIPTTEPRGLFGAIDPNNDGDYSDATVNDADNSGIFRYVSIRHGGTNIGANNEINGLTMGGVGSGTQIDHVEVIFNQDDGFEWFGGTVDCKYLVAAFCGDDAMDYDMGWRGKGQFWFVIQSDGAGSDRGGEHDGGTSPETGSPLAKPVIYNATYIGRGESAGKRGLTFRDNAGGFYSNSIFYDYDKGVDVEILGNGSTHSYDRAQAGDLALNNNIFWNVAGNVKADIFKATLGKYGTIDSNGDTVVQAVTDSLADLAAGNAWMSNFFDSLSNDNVDPVLAGVSRTESTAGLDPRPQVGGPAYQDLAAYSDPFFTQVSYKGAFGASPTMWINGWTYLEEYGYIPVPSSTDITVTDNTGAGTTTWTKNNTYFLDGFVFVNDGDTLIIEAGTVIKGLPGQGADASALIVARGGYIMAEGTKDEPIIFTGSTDDVTNPFDIAANTVGLWGGVIILGKAGTNTVPAEQAIEGIPTTEPRGLFGGSVDDDNSGIFRYVSIRHGGTNIGANNEINGLTMGGVGSATQIDHVEVIFNQDDGFEWFGGTVSGHHLIAAFCGDDAMDYDMGWRGNGQFWFVIQSDDAGSDRGGEHDGGTSPETGTPLATPVIYNATYIGRGESAGKRALTFRDNAGGEYHNSIFYDFARGIDVEILGNGSEHSYDRLQAGDLALRNNIFWNVAGNDSADVFKVTLGKYGTIDSNGDTVAQAVTDSLADLAAGTAFIQAYFDSTNQTVVNPGYPSIDRTEFNNALDPRPTSGFALSTAPASDEPGDPFFTDVDYKGAFSIDPAEFWADEWTYMDQLGYFPATFSALTSIDDKKEFIRSLRLYPNPTRNAFTVAGSDMESGAVEIMVYDMSGRLILTADAMPVAGELETRIDLGTAPAGMYFLKVQQGSNVATAQLVKQ